MPTKKELIKIEKIKTERIKALTNTPEALRYRMAEYKKIILHVLKKEGIKKK